MRACGGRRHRPRAVVAQLDPTTMFLPWWVCAVHSTGDAGHAQLRHALIHVKDWCSKCLASSVYLVQGRWEVPAVVRGKYGVGKG